MKKHLLMLLIFIFVTITLGGCKTIAKEDNLESKDEFQCDASGDGWHISDGTLYLSKIYYTVLNVAGNNCCVYEEPWISYKNENQIRNIVIDADMVYTQESYITDENYAGLDTVDTFFLGGGPLFGNMDSLESVSIKRLNLDKITDISAMFANNSNLIRADISGLDLSKVVNASYLFAYNTSLTNINLEGMSASNLNTVANMFAHCTNLEYVSIPWDTSNVKDFSNMFNSCSALTSANFSGDINNANVSGMFWDCDALNEVQLSNVNLESTIAANAMFNNNNSISSYLFADDWDIQVERNKQIWVISDDCYRVRVISDAMTGIIFECVFYNKEVPDWYKKSVEYIQNLEDFTKISSSLTLDIYCNREEGKFSASDVTEIAIDCLKSTETLSDEEGILINNIVKKLKILTEWKDGSYTVENMAELLEMSEEELEILTGE